MTSSGPSLRDGRYTIALSALFVGSGCAALIYEVVWFHLLRLAIGSSAISLAILLASFMGGMFLGSLLFSSLVPARHHPLKVYGLLELAIGGFGILLPTILPIVSGLYVANTGYGSANIMIRSLICAVCLLPPTILMGATLPAVSRWMATTRTGVAKVGFLYGANTIGAVIGTLLAGFFLLRIYDVVVATTVAVMINLIIGLIGWRLASTGEYRPAAQLKTQAQTRTGNQAVYWVIGLSGLTALGAQVVWTRLLSLLFGATVYTFSVILSVFLIGLGIGSAAGSEIARRTSVPGTALAITQVLLVAAIPYAAFMTKIVIPFVNLPWIRDALFFLSENPDNTRVTNWLIFSLNDILRCAIAILPATLLWGASFPLALAAIRSDRDPGYFVGRIYAANTIGAIVGAIVFSLVVIPGSGTQSAERWLTVLAACAAVLMFRNVGSRHIPFMKQLSGFLTRRVPRGGVVAIGAALFLSVVIILMAAIPSHHPGMIGYGRDVYSWNEPDEYLYTKEGISASVGVSRAKGVRSFHVSGKVVASTNADDMRLQRMLGHFPALFHGNPKSVLVIGFGAGVTAGSFVVHPGIERIVIVEIEPAVPLASGVYFKEENFDVLNDPRVEVVYDDARHYIATTTEKFDVITADPIHPWVKGAAALYSKEFFELTKQRLKSGGVAAQWIPFYETSEAAVKSEIATFFSIFPDGSLWSSDRTGLGYDAIIVGGIDLSQIDFRAMHDVIFDVPGIRRSLSQIGVRNALDILKTFSGQQSDMGDWLESAQMNLDRNLRLEYLAGAALNMQVQKDIFGNMVAGLQYPINLAHLVPGDEKRYRDWFEEHFKVTVQQ